MQAHVEPINSLNYYGSQSMQFVELFPMQF